MAEIEVPVDEDFEIQLGSKAVGDSFKVTDVDGTAILEPKGDGTIGGSTILDEDDMASDSATHLATQQSIKAYADSLAGDCIESEASSTDNQVVRWDGVTGAEVQSSLMTIDDAGTSNIPTAQSYKVNNAQHQHVEADITDLGSYLENVVEDDTPQLGGDLDRNARMSLYSMSLADETCEGDGAEGIVIDGIANSVDFGCPLYYNGTDSTFYATNADDPSTMLCVGLSANPSIITTDIGHKKILFKGTIRQDDWNWTGAAGIGNLIYIGATAGALTQTVPVGVEDIVQCVGWVIDANTMFFDPQLSYTTVSA